MSQMHNITAGDPSRGNISLESEHAPSVGTQAQVWLYGSLRERCF
jgi:hypothetical protein